MPRRRVCPRTPTRLDTLQEFMKLKPYYEEPGITIYHGDCREILPQLNPVDLLLTDPPYGIKEAAGKNKSRGGIVPSRDYGNETWDSERATDAVLLGLGLAKHSIIWGGNYYADLLKAGPCWLVWDKENSGDFADCELAWTSFKQAVRIKRHRWNGMLRKHREERFHPTQKPLDLMTWCITIADKHFPNGVETIVDPFMGSGTTVRAAKNLGRKAIGIEQNEKYCEIAANRLRQGVLITG